jgi:hypothetical protein
METKLNKTWLYEYIFTLWMDESENVDYKKVKKKKPWSESASELYRLSDRQKGERNTKTETWSHS